MDDAVRLVKDDDEVVPLEVVPVDVLAEERVLELDELEPVAVDLDPELLDPVPELPELVPDALVNPVLDVAPVLEDTTLEDGADELDDMMH